MRSENVIQRVLMRFGKSREVMNKESYRRYQISARAIALGGGWKLTLFENGQEVGGGIFPVPEESPEAGIEWWNSLEGKERGYWMLRAESAKPADVYHAYLLGKAYTEAMKQGESWSKGT